MHLLLDAVAPLRTRLQSTLHKLKALRVLRIRASDHGAQMRLGAQVGGGGARRVLLVDLVKARLRPHQLLGERGDCAILLGEAC